MTQPYLIKMVDPNRPEPLYYGGAAGWTDDLLHAVQMDFDKAHQVLSVVVNGQKIIDRLEGNLAKQYSIALFPRYRSIDD